MRQMNVFLLEYEVESFFKYSRVLAAEGLGAGYGRECLCAMSEPVGFRRGWLTHYEYTVSAINSQPYAEHSSC